jgi:MFS family permease
MPRAKVTNVLNSPVAGGGCDLHSRDRTCSSRQAAASTTVTAPPSQLKAPPGLVIAVLAASGASVSMMYSLVTPLLNELVEVFQVSYDNISWTVTATLLANAAATPTMSRLADMHGKRKIMMVCLAFMFVGSMTCALAPTLIVLIIGRTLQGCATAVIPIGISVMRDALPSDRLGPAVALMSASMGLGGTIGIPLSGILDALLGWHAVFLVSAFTGAFMLVAVPLMLRETSVRTGGRFDFLGGFLFSAALLALLLAITKGGVWGWTSVTILSLFVGAFALLALWVPWELRHRMPLIDVRTTLHRPVLLTNIASILLGFAFGGNTLGTLLMFTAPVSTGYGHGFTVLQAGLWMIPSAVCTLAFAPVAARSTGRLGARATLMIGAGLTLAGYVQRIFFGTTVLEIVLSTILVAVGMATAYAAMPTLIMTSVPITETSAANGLNSLLRGAGGAISSAMFGGLLATITIVVGTTVYPSFTAFQIGFVISAAMAAVGGLVAFFIHARPPVEVTAQVPQFATGGSESIDHQAKLHGRTHDVVCHGLVVDQSDSRIGEALVTVTDDDGLLVDWARTESDGTFAIALPEGGQYRAVVSEHGAREFATSVHFGPSGEVARIVVPSV